jgi:hypothetical protein
LHGAHWGKRTTVLVANPLCPWREKHTMCEREAQIASSG